MIPAPANQKTAAWISTALVFLVGFFLLFTNNRLSLTARYYSYDWIHDLSLLFAPKPHSDEVVIVYMDDASHRALDQPFNAPWSRGWHSQLLNRLTQDHASAVVFDIVFTDASADPTADRAFVEAIRASGRVVLAGECAESKPLSDATQSSYERTFFYPWQPFRNAAAKIGFSQLQPDLDFMVREHKHVTMGADVPSLSWAAAEVLDLPITRPAIVTQTSTSQSATIVAQTSKSAELRQTNPLQPPPSQVETAAHPASSIQHPVSSPSRLKERWINYYGSPGHIPRISYKLALEAPPGYFKDKVVFIGAGGVVGFTGERRDEFRSPYTTWFNDPVFIPAVEVHATMLLNLIHNDWLERFPPYLEWIFVLGAAWLFGGFLLRFTPARAAIIATLLVFAITVAFLCFFAFQRLWFPWLIVIAAQAPIGLLSNFAFKSVDWYVQRRKLEQARRAAETRIREQAALLDKAQDAIIVQSLDGHVTYWNPGATQLYGWTCQEIDGQNALELIAAGTRFDFNKAWSSTLERGEWQDRIPQTTKNGQQLVVESRWTLIRDDAGAPKAVLAINTDVTEKHKLELQLQRTQRVESIGTLASGIAHDLNNVLSPILMSSQVLRSKEQDEAKLRRLMAIELSARKGADMVKQVLTFVKGHQGDLIALNLKHIIRDVAKMASETFPSSIKIETHIPADLVPIRGDVTQLTQVFLNLCVNARDAMPNGGTLRIEAKNESSSAGSTCSAGAATNNSDFLACEFGRRPPRPSSSDGDNAAPLKSGPHVSVRVTDTGTGIPQEIIDKIFDPFFTTKGPENNSGLGLSTVSGIIRSLHGYIDVSSKVGQGTVFTLFFPAINEPVAEPEPVPANQSLNGQNQTVLIVSSDPLLRGVLDSLLTQYQYHAIQAPSFDAATLCIKDSPPAILLFDEPNPCQLLDQFEKLSPGIQFLYLGSLPPPQDPRIHVASKPITLTTLLTDILRIWQK